MQHDAEVVEDGIADTTVWARLLGLVRPYPEELPTTVETALRTTAGYDLSVDGLEADANVADAAVVTIAITKPPVVIGGHGPIEIYQGARVTLRLPDGRLASVPGSGLRALTTSGSLLARSSEIFDLSGGPERNGFIGAAQLCAYDGRPITLAGSGGRELLATAGTTATTFKLEDPPHGGQAISDPNTRAWNAPSVPDRRSSAGLVTPDASNPLRRKGG